MPIGPTHPTVRQVQALAESFGIDMTEEEAATYRELMKGTMESYRRIDAMVETKPEIKYPRGAWHRPQPEDNPYNAWYAKTEIKGAASGVLQGLKVGIKDAICVAGLPMMNGSRVLEGWVPDIDATVVTRVLDAGGTVVGKCQSEDFSFSGGSHTASLGPVRNPHKPTHATGASSNGNAAAIAAGDCQVAIGGDQGGSIRIPACWSGVVGLKPTYGLVPYTGAMMIEMTMDHLGPMADTVENAARLLTAIAGPDPLDPRQRGVVPADYVEDYLPAIDRGCKDIKIGVLKEGFGFSEPYGDTGLPGSEEIVDKKVTKAIEQLEKRGASVSKVSNPRHEDALHLWNAIALEGATAFMLKGNGIGTNWRGFYNTQLLDNAAKSAKARPNDLSVTVKLVLLLGEYMQTQYYGRYYAKAQNIRDQVKQAYDDLLKSCDVLITPTVPFRATPIPDNDAPIEERVSRALNMLHNTAPFDLTGHPSISVPCGQHDDLPIGLMVTGRHFEDLTVLQVADAVEKTGDWREL